MSEELFKRLRSSNRLPSPPGVALQILELSRSDDSSLDDMAKAITTDPALTGRILKFVNSPSAGMGRRISTLDEAVNQLGMRGVTLMALSFSLVSATKSEACPGFSLDKCWSRSLACAVAAKKYASLVGRLDPNEAFIMGLLLHIGQLAMACALPEAYEPVLKAASEKPETLLDLEKEHLGATHIVAGARLLQDWRLPDGIWQTIAQVQLPPAPGETFPSGRIPAARVLGIADLTASLLCETREGGPEAVQNAIKLALETFDLGEEAWAKVYEEVSADWRVYGQLLSVKAGTTKSFAALQEEARDQITALTLATHLENLGIKEQNQQLLQQTRIDGMTGISNRVAFDERLASELERARRTKRPLVLCMLDVDHFKKFNDTHGHQVGDKVLQAVAKSLDDTIRKMDLVARYGGEEFVVIAPECSPSSIGLLAERLRAAVSENALKINDQTLQITVSVGVAFAQWDQYPRTATELIEAADGRLYEAKRAGRNCCKFEPELSKAA